MGRLLIGSVAIVAIVGACGSSAPATVSPSTQRPPTAAPATPTPAPSGTMRPAASRDPTKPSGDPYARLDAFLDEFAGSDAPFHTEATITILGDAPGYGSMDLDVSGDELAGHVELTAGGQRVEYEQVDVDDRTYIRRPGADWTVHPHTLSVLPLNPFWRLARAKMNFGFLTRPPGRPWVYEFWTDDWIGEDPASAGSTVEDATIESTRFTVYVDEEGVPVNALLQYSVGGTADGNPVDVDYLVQYEFLDVGEPVTIDAPEMP